MDVIWDGLFPWEEEMTMGAKDEWCDLCDDKLKVKKVKMNGRIYWVCGHCASLTVEDGEE